LWFWLCVSGASITHAGRIINPRHEPHIPPMPKPPASRATPWRIVLIVCRKCSTKLDGGFGRKRKESLKSVLRQNFRDAGRRRDIRICEAACLGVCPKGGVTALNATHPGTIHVISAGTDAVAAMELLLGGHPLADGLGVEPA
jgi:hypothetical protein